MKFLSKPVSDSIRTGFLLGCFLFFSWLAGYFARIENISATVYLTGMVIVFGTAFWGSLE